MTETKTSDARIIHLERMNKLLLTANKVMEEVMLNANIEKESATFMANSLEKIATQKEKEMIHADRMSILGIISAGIAHEIKNPTTFISGNVLLLEEMWSDIALALEQNKKTERLSFICEEVPKMLRDMKQGVKRIVHIVDGFKFFARKDDFQITDCDIAHALEQAKELCHPYLKNKIVITDNVSRQLPNIKANIQQLEQVFINLITNAADAIATSVEKKIFISSELDTDRRLIFIKIEDTGPGIPKDKLQAIFRPFYTTKESGKGTGLGLSISANIMEKIGGRLSAGNRKDNTGAIFTLEIPY